MKFVILFVLTLAVQPAFGQNDLDINQFYPIDAGHSYIEFAVKYMGHARVKGRFAEFNGMFRYDPDNESTTSVTLSIKTQSLDTDHDFRDKDLKSENWFDTETFPLIRFTSSKATKTSSGLDVTGVLTIRDVTKEVTLTLQQPSGVLKDVRGDAQVIFTGEITIDRTDYDVQGKRWSAIKEGITAVENEVAIEFSILGKQLKAPNFSNRVRNDQRPPGKLYKIISDGGVDACLAEFMRMKEENAVNENTMITVATMLLLEEKADQSIKLLEANIKAFPQSSYTQYYTGHAYASTGDWSTAKLHFLKASALDNNNSQAAEVLKHLK